MNQMMSKSQSSLSPQMSSYSAPLQIPQSSTPQPQSQQTPVHQPPRAASVPETRPQTPSTPQSQNQTQSHPPQLQQQSLPSQNNAKPTQSTVLNIEDNNEDIKPFVALSQESGVTSVNQNDTNQSTTPVSSVSDQGSFQTGGKVFAFASQKSAGESNSSDKMDVDTEVKSEGGKSEMATDSKSMTNMDVKVEIKQETEDPGYTANSTVKEETVVKEEQSSPKPASAASTASETKPDTSNESSQAIAKLKRNKKSKQCYFLYFF